MQAYADALVADMLRAAPDALRISKRSFDVALESSLLTALELEERGQIQMIRACLSTPQK